MRAISLHAFAPFTRPIIQAPVVTLARDPGHPHRWKFKAEVHALLDAGTTHVVIDCTDAGYLDGRDRGVLISLSRRAKERDGSLVLRGLNAELRELFARTGMDTVLTVEEGER